MRFRLLVQQTLLLLLISLLGGCLTHSVDSRHGEEKEIVNIPDDPGEYPPYRVVVGYTPSWRGDVADIDYEKLTHINYAFHMTDSVGNIVPTWSPDGLEGDHDLRLQKLVNFAHQKDVHVLLAIGGATDRNFGRFAVHADLRQNFYKEIKRVVQQYNLDGIDIDWEYPETTEQGEAFEALMLGVRKTLDQLDSNLLLTVAVGASTYGTSYISAKAVEPCDWINIMTYDFTGGWASSGVGPTAPMSFAISGCELWKEKGVSFSRMALGIPFYGIRFAMNGKNRVEAAQMSYSDLDRALDLNRMIAADTLFLDTFVVKRVTLPDSTFRYDTLDVDRMYFYWDTPQLVGEKTVYALSKRMRGVMIWELSQDVVTDSLSLLHSIWDEMQEVLPEVQKREQ